MERSTRSVRRTATYRMRLISIWFVTGNRLFSVRMAGHRWKDYLSLPLPNPEGGRIPRAGRGPPKGGRITISAHGNPLLALPCPVPSPSRPGRIRGRKKTALRPFLASKGRGPLYFGYLSPAHRRKSASVASGRVPTRSQAWNAGLSKPFFTSAGAGRFSSQ